MSDALVWFVRQLQSLVVAIRPQQWTKNLVVLAALIFAERLYDPHSLLQAVAAFGVFCALAGAIYLLNDLADLEGDRLHPVKRMRPIASGALSPRVALAAAVALGALGLVGGLAIGAPFAAVALTYLVAMTAYSFHLKNVVILDVLVVAFGFVLRAIAGAVAIGVVFSNWLLICTLLLALFLALAKRRQELTFLAREAAEHRRILGEYSPNLLDQMIAVVTASTLISYALYTLAPETVDRFGTDRMIWTLPFVLYGIFRYLYLVHQKEEGGNPTRVLLDDRPILVTVALWAATVITLIYHGSRSSLTLP
ncbi:MAG TPA: decaprenyl-phosphate phosphoribosyltransferase [Vicinamibacteria bacterium]|nr:decaprenyl-phosphate phosphoribosyltransferase [Vicinamibacteria bacterium]